MSKLNLGCGPLDIREGFVNIDLRDIPGVIRRDVSDRESMMVFAGAEEILAYDILEHFDRQTSREAIQLWADLLKPGGVLKIRCPDLRHAVKAHTDDKNLEMLIYGGQDYPENYHKTGYTVRMMQMFLPFVGLKIRVIATTPAGNLEVEAVKE